MLPWQLSQGGPGIAWVNVLGGHREQLVIGCGRGGWLWAYTYDGLGGMIHLPIITFPMTEDVTGIVGRVGGAGERVRGRGIGGGGGCVQRGDRAERKAAETGAELAFHSSMRGQLDLAKFIAHEVNCNHVFGARVGMRAAGGAS